MGAGRGCASVGGGLYYRAEDPPRRMPSLEPYLIFPGTCREALGFYADVFEGQISLLETYRHAPVPFPVGAGDAGRVFNAVFRAGGLRFRASDHLAAQQLAPGERMALFLAFATAGAQAQAYDALAKGGRVLMPLADGFGMVEDRYAVRWMLALDT